MAYPQGQNAAVLALSRFGFGARAGDLAAVAADPVGMLRDEIQKKAVGQPSGPDLVSSLEAASELDEFKTARKLAREKEAARKEAAEMQQAGTGAMTPEAGAPQAAGAKAAAKPMGPRQRFFRAETMARLDLALGARTGLAERLVWFWSNHFCISLMKGGLTAALVGSYEREAIRPHVFGRFEDMLLAVEHHPAMLAYLDNQRSIGPNSRAGIRRDKGLNENLARETLELHTLGVGGGYTQEDVTSLARMLTGWTIVGRNDEEGELGSFAFRPFRHEPGPQTLLGRSFPDGGMEQGEAALRFIAGHPATARHIATKLARHFVADDPPLALVDRLATTFQKTRGDLTAVSLALIEAPESWQAPAAKLRSPQEFLVASLRATGLPVADIGRVNGPLKAMGQLFWSPAGPNGYSDRVADWASPEGLTTRLDFALALSKRVPPQINPLEIADAIMGDALSKESRQAIQRAESKPQGLALLLMSPEFQRR